MINDEGGGGYIAIQEDISEAMQEWYDTCAADLAAEFGLPDPSQLVVSTDGTPIYTVIGESGQEGWIRTNDGGDTMTFYDFNPAPGTEDLVLAMMNAGVNTSTTISCE